MCIIETRMERGKPGTEPMGSASFISRPFGGGGGGGVGGLREKESLGTPVCIQKSMLIGSKQFTIQLRWYSTLLYEYSLYF